MTKGISQSQLEDFIARVTPQLSAIRDSFQSYCDEAESNGALSQDSLSLVAAEARAVAADASDVGLTDVAGVAGLLTELASDLPTSESSADWQQLLWQFISALEYSMIVLPESDVDLRGEFEAAIRSYFRFKGQPESEDESEIERIIGSAVEGLDVDEFRVEAADIVQLMLDLISQDRELEEAELVNLGNTLNSIKERASSYEQLDRVAEIAAGGEQFLSFASLGGVGLTTEQRFTLLQAVDAIGEIVESGETSADTVELLQTLTAHQAAEEEESSQAEGDSANEVYQADANVLEELKSDLEVSIPNELYEVYREEAEDHIRNIYAALNQLKTDPANRECLQNIRRSAHTLKGAAGAVGVRIVTNLSHRMEDLLDWLYESDKQPSDETLTLLLNTTDRLHELSFGEYDKDSITHSVAELYGQYGVHLQGIETDKSEAATPSETEKADDETQEIPATASAPEEPAKSKTEKPAALQQMLRVPLSRVDELVRTVSELIINRTTFEQRMSNFVHGVDELNTILNRLRAVAQEMETTYGIDALGGTRFRSGGFLPRPASMQDEQDTEFDALEFDQYNDFHLLSRSVSEITSDVGTIASEFRTLIGDFDSLLARQNRLSRETQDRLMRVRMVPLASLSTRLHRAVRVVSSKQGKPVELIIDGEETALDKTVLEEIADPLMHLLRNAVDHGVEAPESRESQGKSSEATIRIKAFYQGTQAVLKISDDGGGLNAAKIAESAIKKGHLSEAEAEAMAPQELYPYIFVPGLSTAKELSEVSGRGVGMDIVRDKVQKLKGTITVDSEPGVGTTFTISLPLTLAVTRALMVVSGGELFAIPMQSVAQIARLEKNQIDQLAGSPIIRLDGAICPIIRLCDHLAIRSADDDASTIPVLVIQSGEKRLAVQVEEIVAGKDIVVKTLGSHLRQVDGLIGSTLLGDGTVVPILDPNSLIVADETEVPTVRSGRTKSTVSRGQLTVMIVDDSVSVRRVMENLAKSKGWIPVVAKDGIDALEIMQGQDIVPDIFLLDVEMPRMDGYELLRRLRSTAATKDSPVVMVTSRAGEKHRQKAFSLGATEYLVKPYQEEQLTGLVERLAGGNFATTPS